MSEQRCQENSAGDPVDQITAEDVLCIPAGEAAIKKATGLE